MTVTRMTARMEIKYIECLLLIRVDSLFMVTVERERAAKENDIPPGSRSTVTGFLFIV